MVRYVQFHQMLIMLIIGNFILIIISDLEMAGKYNYSRANVENETLQTNRYERTQKLTHQHCMGSSFQNCNFFCV